MYKGSFDKGEGAGGLDRKEAGPRKGMDDSAESSRGGVGLQVLVRERKEPGAWGEQERLMGTKLGVRQRMTIGKGDRGRGSYNSEERRLFLRKKNCSHAPRG